MEEFSYLSVLLSIILGLAVTEILTGFRGLLQARGRVLLYWPSLLWCFILLVIYAQTWWSMFGLRAQHDWSFAGFAVVLMHMILLYMQAGLVLPPMEKSESIDLRANYFAQHRWFYSIALLVVGVSLVKDLVLSGHLPNATNVVFHGVFAALAAAGAITRAEWFHKIFAILAAALVALYIGLLFTRLN